MFWWYYSSGNDKVWLILLRSQAINCLNNALPILWTTRNGLLSFIKGLFHLNAEECTVYFLMMWWISITKCHFWTHFWKSPCPDCQKVALYTKNICYVDLSCCKQTQTLLKIKLSSSTSTSWIKIIMQEQTRCVREKFPPPLYFSEAFIWFPTPQQYFANFNHDYRQHRS